MSATSGRRWLLATVLLAAFAVSVWPGFLLLQRAHGDERDAQGSVSGNDGFAAAWAVAGLPFIGEQDTTGMTTEPGEPLQPGGCIAGPAEKGATVWFQYTPSSSGPLTASTGGSSYDTVLAVYTGSSVDSLTLVACNDDGVGVQSLVTFQATGAVTYHIQVGGYQAATGDLRLLLQVASAPPPTPTSSATPNPTATPTRTATPPEQPGDASCDGSVTSLDALLVLQFVAELLPTLPCPSAADVDGSGAVSAIDATIILQFVAGLIAEL